MITYSTSLGSSAARESASRIAIAPSSVAGYEARAPPRRPKGVRTAATMTDRLTGPAYRGGRGHWHTRTRARPRGRQLLLVHLQPRPSPRRAGRGRRGPEERPGDAHRGARPPARPSRGFTRPGKTRRRG